MSNQELYNALLRKNPHWKDGANLTGKGLAELIRVCYNAGYNEGKDTNGANGSNDQFQHTNDFADILSGFFKK